MIVDMFKLMLEELGYSVISCTNSLEALKTFQSNPEKFDLIITDLTMPNMTGIELIKCIRSQDLKTPVILITGYSEDIDMEQRRRFKINHLITKPLIAEDMARTVRKVFNPGIQ